MQNLSFLVIYLSCFPHQQWTTKQQHTTATRNQVLLQHDLQNATTKTRPYSVDMSGNAGALHDLHLKAVDFNQYGCAAHGKLLFL